MKAKIHAAAGVTALVLVLSFWLSTVVTELMQDPVAITAAKAWILRGMAVLVPALAIAGASGFSLAAGWKSRQVERKRMRMKLAAANGLIILVPSAFFLAARAEAGLFDATFLAVQGLELVAGVVNIALLSLNLRDGLAMRHGRMRAQRVISA